MKQIPTSLAVVAALFVLGGISAVIEMLVALTQNKFTIHFGVLGFFIGRGLLRLSRGWRTCGLVFIWIALVFIPIWALLVIFARAPVNFTVFGEVVGTVPKMLALLIGCVIYSVALWTHRVLVRPDVLQLFGLGSSPASCAQSLALLNCNGRAKHTADGAPYKLEGEQLASIGCRPKRNFN